MPIRLPTPPVRYDPVHQAQQARALQTYVDQNDAAVKSPAAAYTPTHSADPKGAIGAVAADGGFVYVKTAAGWLRAALASF